MLVCWVYAICFHVVCIQPLKQKSTYAVRTPHVRRMYAAYVLRSRFCQTKPWWITILQICLVYVLFIVVIVAVVVVLVGSRPPKQKTMYAARMPLIRRTYAAHILVTWVNMFTTLVCK